MNIKSINPLELSGKLERAIAMWRERHSQSGDSSPTDWHLSQSCHCDDFAQAIGQCLGEMGLPHEYCIITRETRDEHDEVLDCNHFSHAFVRIQLCRHELEVDSLGDGASDRFTGGWQDEDDQQTDFDFEAFGALQEMRDHLRTSIDGYGAPRSSPERADLIEAWATSLRECLVEAGLRPDAETAPAPLPVVRVYLKLAWDINDPKQWFAADVPTTQEIAPDPQVDKALLSCLRERVLHAAQAHASKQWVNPDYFEGFLEDGRHLNVRNNINSEAWELTGETSSVESVASDDLPDRLRIQDLLDQQAHIPDALLEKADVTSPGAWGNSLLNMAARAANPDLCARLIAMGADVNAPNGAGFLPINEAAGSLVTLRCLVHAGADINQVNGYGNKPADQAFESFNGRDSGLWLLTQGARANATGAVVINLDVEDLQDLYASDNNLSRSSITPKMAAVLGDFVPELLNLLEEHPQAERPEDELDALRSLSSRASNNTMVAAIDAHRSSMVLKHISKQHKGSKP